MTTHKKGMVYKMNKCLSCVNRIGIPLYLKEDYKRIGVDVSTGDACGLTNQAIDVFDICDNFVENEIWEDD